VSIGHRVGLWCDFDEQRLGCGFRTAHACIAAIVDRDLDKAKALVAGIRCEESIETAILDPDIDLVDICLPPHMHVDVACAALGAGKHVICEKPLATTLQDVDKLCRVSGEMQRSIFPIFQYRFGPGLRVLKHLIDTGFAGKPLVAALETHWNRGADYYSVPWRGTWDGEQGGAILGHAIHAHDILSWLFGPIAGVSARLTTRANKIETEDCAALIFDLENGAVSTSSVTLGAATDETRLRFVFDELTATSGALPYAPADGNWTFTARDPRKQSLLDTKIAAIGPCRSGFEGAFFEISRALNGLANDAVTFEDGAGSIELVTAIYAAARSGSRVALPLPADHELRKGWRP
jgi:predicted dehydrogenase